jgi:hypothetical protein
MWFRTPKRKPGPTGTGKIFEVGRWSFWDDVISPGLIRSEWELAKAALPDADLGKYATTNSVAHIVSAGKRDKRAISKLEEYRKQFSRYLQQEADEFRVSPWLIRGWDASSGTDGSEGLEILHAYVDILEYWGHQISFRRAYDVQGQRQMGILTRADWALTALYRHNERLFKRRPRGGNVWMEYCLHAKEVRRIEGMPSKFTVELRDSKWDFDARTGEMLVGKL